MFRDSTSFSRELSPAEQVAFEQLVRAVGFTREVRFGRGRNAKVLHDFPAELVYALTPIERVGPKGVVREYRLFVALAAFANGGAPKAHKRATPARAREAKPAKVKRGSAEFRAKMSEIGRANWRKRVKKFGPTGVTPGREPWKMPNNIAYQKHAAKVAKEQGEPQAPAHPIKTF